MAREREKDFGVCRACYFRDVCNKKMCDTISLVLYGCKMNERKAKEKKNDN